MGADGWSRGSTFRLTWSAPEDLSGIARVYYAVGTQPRTAADAAGSAAAADTLTVIVGTDGELPIYLWLEDGAGNSDPSLAASVTVRRDATAPAAPVLLSPPAGRWVSSGEVALSWAEVVDEHSGVAIYRVFADGVLVDSTAGTSVTVSLPEGLHSWSVRAADMAGNTGPAGSATFGVDRVPPDLVPGGQAWADPDRQVELVGDAWWNLPSPAFAWPPAEDAGAGVAGYAASLTTDAADTVLIGSVLASAELDLGEPLTAEGSYYLRVRAVDGAGNWSAAATLFEYRYDATAPSLPGSARGWVDASRTAELTSGQSHGGPLPQFAWEAAQDEDSGVVGYAASFTTDAQDTVALDAVLATPELAPREPLVDEGSYYLRVRAVDGAGNWSAATTLFEYRYDGTAPSLPAAASAWVDGGRSAALVSGGWQRSATPVFAWEAGEGEPPSGWAAVLTADAADTVSLETVLATPALEVGAPLQEGRSYYLRVRAVDGAGNWSAAATLFEVRYDGTAPSLPESASGWADAAATEALTSGVWAARPAARFTWASAADAGSGVAGYAAALTADPQDTVSLETVLATSALEVGAPLQEGRGYYLRVRAVDGAGNWSAATTLFEARYDATAPSLDWTPPETQALARDLPLRARLSDSASGVVEAAVHYRRGGSTGYTNLPMSQAPDGAFEATIPGGELGPEGLQLYLEAVDAAGNRAADPGAGAAAPHSVALSFQELLAPATVVPDLWRMVSVPVWSDRGEPLEVLAALGTYDPRRWRAFRYSGGAYREITDPGVGPFAPGRAFWLHARIAGATLRAGSGRTTVLDGPFEVRLEPGWNDLATPFAFAVAWDEVLAASGDPAGVAGPYAYDGRAWSFPTPQDRLEPWQGYAVKNASAAQVALRIPPSAAPAAAGKPAAADDEWTVQLCLTTRSGSDEANFLGFRRDAAAAWDRADLPDPPAPPGGGPRLYFPHLDWSGFPDLYTSDFRPAEEQVWAFTVEAEAGSAATLRVRTAGPPPGLAVDLRDADRRTARPLADGPLAVAFSDGPRRRFEVVVRAAGATAPGLPAAFSLLPNRPNPFNPETVIPIALPERAAVSLSVHDVLGRRVAVLRQGVLDAGWHEAAWDGRDEDGRPLASGVYVAVLEHRGGVATRKLLLLR